MYPGPHVPYPLEVIEHVGDSPSEVLSRQVMGLTKLNWNSADFSIREPITLAFARRVGEVMGSVPEEVEPRPDYRFYM
jgi:hypothetical protein